jgi:hypothetical protein
MRSGEYPEWGLVTLTCQHEGRRRGEIAGQLARFVLVRSGQRAGFAALCLLPDLLSMRRRARPGQTSLLT